MVISTITLLSTIYKRTTESTGTLPSVLPTVQITTNYQRLTMESWFTNLEQTPLNRCLQLPATYKRLIDIVKETDKQ